MLLIRYFFLQGGSCRTRVVKHLSKEYASLSRAEASLKIDYVSGNDIICDDSVNCDAFTTGTPQRSTIIDELLSPVFHSSPAMHVNTTTRATGDIVKEFVTCYKNMSSRLK